MALSCILLLVASGAAAPGGRMSEQQYFDGIRGLTENKNETTGEKLALEFFKAFPGSKHAPAVRLMLADMESSPSEAVSKYGYVINKFRRFEKNDYARYRMCEIHYLTSDWKKLKTESLNGKNSHPLSRHRDQFANFLIFAYMQLGEYDSAERECLRLIENNHDYNGLAASLLVLASIHKKSSGLSKQYIGTLREIATGFGESDSMPSALFLIGDLYEQKKMYDESYSAYSDLLSKYPGSPESAEAGKRIKLLLKFAPQKKAFLPGKKIMESAEAIDISPEIDIQPDEGSSFFYSLSLGPIASLKNAAEIKKLLNEYDFIKTVRLKRGYAVYVSKCPDEESVLRVKIRLAEEFGLNGRIVRISGDGKNSYIYGE